MERDSKSIFGKGSPVTELSPNDFDPISPWKLKGKKCCIILFYAPWCPHCRNMKDVWERLAKRALFFDVYAFNCEKHKEHMLRIREYSPGMVTSYPTIHIYRKGSPSRLVTQYERDNIDTLIELCKETCL